MFNSFFLAALLGLTGIPMAPVSPQDDGGSQPPSVVWMPDGSSIVVALDRSTAVRGGRFWSGRIADDPGGTIDIVLRDDGVARGYLRGLAGDTWRIERDAQGRLAATPFDIGSLPPCGGATKADQVLRAPQDGGLAGTCDSGAVIDLLVLYTPVARDAAGGVGAIEAEIVLAVQLANQAYVNSNVATKLNLVGLEIIAYDESGSYGDHLTRLTTVGDGFMDEAHVLRDVLGADIVDLIVDDGDACGIAWLAPFDPTLGFSVTTWYCAAGNLTLAHELGHNQGCCHAVGDGGGCDDGGVFPYSVGHRFFGSSGQLWRTVMAYAPGARIPHFSNPDVTFDGVPTGVPVGSPGEAHNALTINQTAQSVANFRCSLSPETWVDFAYVGVEVGTFAQPFNTMAEGVQAVPNGGTLSIKAGASSTPITITKPMSIQAYGGLVTIGGS